MWPPRQAYQKRRCVRRSRRKREIAVDVQVKAPAVQTVDIDVGVHLSTGETLEAAEKAVETVLRAYFTGARLGCAVPLSELYALLNGLNGIAGYRILSPVDDVAVSVSVLPVLGKLSVQALD